MATDYFWCHHGLVHYHYRFFIHRHVVVIFILLYCHMQMWDVQTCEYEGNLYHDASVKDTRNPSLHNHGGKAIGHASVSEDGRYLVCAGADHKASLWDLENEIILQSYAGHTDEVRPYLYYEANTS